MRLIYIQRASWAIVFLYGCYLIVDEGFFQNQLSWDGIFAIVAIVLALLLFLSPLAWGYWRRLHPLRAFYSKDPYDLASDIQEHRLTTSWELGWGGPHEMLIKIVPHRGTTLRNVRLRFVERRWFSKWRLFRWVVADRKTINMGAMIDMLYQNSSSTPYYFESDIEPPVGSFLGEYFNGHDPSKGVDVSAGSGLWVGMLVTAWGDWAGRLEIDTVVDGQRIFERKPLRVSDSADIESMTFSLGEMRKGYPVISSLPGDADTSLTLTPSPELAPDTASPRPQSAP